MASQDWFEKDFYAILGVPADADAKKVKSTYRKLARQWHPDSKPGDAAAEKKFKEIGEAYAVLSDPEQRKQYDAVRAMSRGGARFTAGGAGGAGGAGFEDVFAQMFGGAGPGAGGQGGGTRFSTAGGQGINIEDLLGGFAGGGQYAGGSPFQSTRGPRPGRNVEARTTIDFTSAASGDTVTLQTPEGGRVTTRIPAGVKDGQKIRLRGKGLAGDPGAPHGDLMLVVTVRPHPVFGREGNNLTLDLPVTFAEAALGATVPVPTLDGGTVKVKIAAGTPSGRVLRVKGRGIKASSGTGDLLAKVTVVVPQRLTDKAREAVEVLAAEEDGADPRADLMQRARE
ncbi:DnaJ C-terminal domain-containing protein [Ornithinimicrobium cryptoxanthini]|uniref:DnaJ domain-containing protein n=1 Tax=Ornithinimicrobium cryptoxanthini TaxID=2934161 RepID=A0ABY4YI67_9MICO|nr:DnaJ C-terminal domain-containing protein [Ornithinimicrobium cryptoxanthini]USQ76038.1 DnaJ domain-containing protein [Ornithinimicrobium cryptoxanthini]